MPRPSNHHYYIPRMTLEFDPSLTGCKQEFSITTPDSDIDNAEYLVPRLRDLPKLNTKEGFRKVMTSQAQERDGATLTVAQEASKTVLRFGFEALPEPVKMLEDADSPNMLTRHHRYQVLGAVARATSLQYRFAVPPDLYDKQASFTPSRFSFGSTTTILEPRIVVTEQLHDSIIKITPKKSTQLTNEVRNYLEWLEGPTRLSRFDILSDMKIGKYGMLLSNNGDYALGNRRGDLTRQNIEIVDDENSVRYQPGDSYEALPHNFGYVPYAELISMVAVGALNREYRLQSAEQEIS